MSGAVQATSWSTRLVRATGAVALPAAVLALAAAGPRRAALYALAALLLTLAWRRGTERWACALAFAALLARAAGDQAARPVAQPAAALEARLMQARARLTARLTELGAAARAVAAVGSRSGEAPWTDSPARARVFEELESARGASSLELALRAPSLEPVAWAGRPTDLTALGEGLAGRESVIVVESALATSLVALVPLRAPDGHLTALATAEQVQASRFPARARFARPFDRLTDDLPGVEARWHGPTDTVEDMPFGPAPPDRATREETLRGRDGRALVSLRASDVPLPRAPQGAEWARRLASLCAMLALAAWGYAGRRALGVRALSTSLALRALLLLLGPCWPAPDSALLAPATYGSPALGPLLRSPLDLLATVALATHAAAVLLARLARRPVPQPSAARLLACACLAPPLLALPFAFMAQTTSATTLDLDAFTLVPRSASHLALQVSLALVLALGGALLTALMSVGGPLPRALGARLILGAGLLAIGWASNALWPRHLLGLPLLPALALFGLAGLLGLQRARWQPLLQTASPTRRAAAVPVAAALGGLLLQPSLAHFGEKEVRRQIERDEAALIRRQPRWRDYALEQSCRQIDAARPGQRLDPEASALGVEQLAFALWSATDLAALGFSSAVEVQDEHGVLLSRFALNLEWLEAPPAVLPEGERWTVDRARVRLGSAERVVLHARRRLTADGALTGGLHVYLADDFADLPFLPARDAYAAFYRAEPPAGARGRNVELMVYDRAGRVRFTSVERPPALTPELRERGQRSPDGFWTTLPVDERPHHTFVFTDAQGTYALGYPQRRAARVAGDLLEAAAALALLALAALLALVLARSAAGRATLSLPALIAGVQRRFALRLFTAFVVVALVPLAVLQGVVAGFVRERLRRAAEDQALERASVARKAVEDFVLYQRQEPGPGAPAVTDAALVWIASLIRNDLDVFADGRLLASSKRELYASGLLSTRVPGAVFRELALQGRPRALSNERLGEVAFRVVSVPVGLGETRGILRVPLALRERELETVLGDLERVIRLASLVFLLAGAALAQGMARRIAGPLRDLTAATRRVADGDLMARVEARSHDELRGLVEGFNQMAADLERQRRDLERSNRLAAWAEMARQVAHEVKNPLTPIQLSAEHLRRVWRDPGADFGAALETCTATILRQVRTLRDMVTEFSAFARPPAGEPVEVELGALLNTMLESYAALPVGVELRREFEPEGARVYGDRRLLERACVNLLENALQAVDGHGRVVLRLRAEVEHGRALVEVEDSGPGVAPELGERIFEPFFSTKTGGSGLGLALVRKIAEEHGGGVALVSQPGQTCARLWLPLRSHAGHGLSAGRAPTDG